MKVIKKQIGEKSEHVVSAKSWDIVINENSLVIELDSCKTLIIEGELYYCRLPDGKIRLIKNVKSKIGLIKTLCAENCSNITSSIEGTFVAAVLDKKKDSVLVMGDAFARVNMFYHEDNDNCIASTNIADVLSQVKDIGYQQEVIYCILMLGYPPAKHTPYKKVRRLAHSEQLLFRDGRKTVIDLKINELKIRPMAAKDHKAYAKIFENAILSRISDIENWVMISGGWDSTIMLAALCKFLDKRRIKPIVTRLLLPNGKCYNPYEVSKSRKIASYYGLKCEVADAWLGSENTYDHISGISSNLRSNILFDWMPAFYDMAEIIKKKGRKGAAIFYGGFSDALHNFGFSQYSSLPYISYDFREYSDKMRNYLYSPSFLTKVLNSSYEKDFLFKLFWWHANSEQDLAKNSDSNDAILNYLLSFIISDFRIPFARIARETIFNEDARASFKKWLHDNYFKEAAENINPGNMYFYLIQLYKYFHLQGSQYSVIQSSFEGSGFHPRLPFLDMQLAEFLAQMPENWGRGLEWRRIKYPLKQYADRSLDIPVDIIESDFHSYIDEKEDEERLIDWKAEMVNASPLGLRWRDTDRQQIVDRIFDKKGVDVELIKKMLSNACNPSTSKLHLSLVTFLSVGLE
ncbi:MAG: hypothetical protein A3F91_01975 [Flavobacteria bacterium RIFCSPLOWO2_12_FULL_35_11]|nr:MAG: hypothetical protein A3F91_01975 [Flavobacteria bacterium RIFCSPLOWO2_12_FULL_35_11]